MHLSEELLGTSPVVDPFLVSGDLFGGDQMSHGLAVCEGAPLPVRTVELRWLRAALAAEVAAPGEPLGDSTSEHVADLGQLGGELAIAVVEDLDGGPIRPLHERVRG